MIENALGVMILHSVHLLVLEKEVKQYHIFPILFHAGVLLQKLHKVDHQHDKEPVPVPVQMLATVPNERVPLTRGLRLARGGLEKSLNHKIDAGVVVFEDHHQNEEPVQVMTVADETVLPLTRGDAVVDVNLVLEEVYVDQ